MINLSDTMRWKLLVLATPQLLLWWCHSVVADRNFIAPYQMSMVSQLQVEGPCLASLIGPAATSCIQWEPNVTAYPTYEPSRLLIISGAADHLLHITKADDGRPLAKVPVAGRVITEAVFGAGNAVFYVGTDKGKFYAFDAYSFKPIFSINADSKINNNITIVDKQVVFTSSVGTIYAVDSRTGVVLWQVAQPLARDRLHLAPQSNIEKHEDLASKSEFIMVPHADGYVSTIDAHSGKLKKKTEVTTAQSHGFPDIVAPMVAIKNRLWVASNDGGVAIIDSVSARIRELVPIHGVIDMVSDGSSVYLATTDTVYRMNEAGEVLWKGDIAPIVSRTPRAAFPFEHFAQGAKRMFFGFPTGMLVDDKRLVISYSLGSLGVFDKESGRLIQIAGNSVGFSSIKWAGPQSIIAVSKRGLLMKFQEI